MPTQSHKFTERLNKLRQSWPPARVLKWSRILSRGCLVASPLIFCAGVAFSLYKDNEARRLYPDEPVYDVATGEELLTVGLAFMALLLAAVFSVVGSRAKALISNNPE